jgi:hypothetical protein
MLSNPFRFYDPPVAKSLPSDYDLFLNYSNTAPDNRRPDNEWMYGNPRQYDHYGMWVALGRPQDFNEAIKNNPDWVPDEGDGLYHGFSVGNDGVFLKSHIPGEYQPGNTTWKEYLGHSLNSTGFGPSRYSLVFDPDIQRMRYIENRNYQRLFPYR